MSFNVPIFISGIRDGETIVGTSNSNQGTVITIKGNYPANRKSLEDSYNHKLYGILSLLPSFNGIKKGKIYEKIYIDGTDTSDLYMNDVDLYVRFDNIGGTAFKNKLTDEQIDYILAGNPNNEEGFWHIKDVYNMIPANKPGSKAKRHTLIFRPSIWSLTVKTTCRSEGAGLIISTSDGSIRKYYKVKDKTEVMYEINYNDTVFMKYPLYIIANKVCDFKFNLESMKEIAIEILTDKIISISNINDQWDLIYNTIKWFTPAVHKSLIQKIIRTGCNTVSYKDNEYNSDIVLLLSFSMLITSPGAFIPDIKRYVTGFESAAKRLAVSIFEDSYTDHPEILLSMMASALLYENAKQWKPTRETIKSWMKCALDAKKDKRMFEYKVVPHISLSVETYDSFSVSAMLLKEIKSFQSDLIMMNYIAKYKGTYRNYITNNLIDTIPLLHCIDFHSMPHMAYLYDLDMKKYNISGLSNIPDFNKLYKRIFNEVTGVNPRKEKYKKFITDKCVIDNYYNDYESYDFVKETRNVQRRLWNIKSKQDKIDRNTINHNEHESYKFDYTLDESWLAGIVGPITIKLSNGLTTLVNIHPDNINKLVAILKPSRTNKDAQISEQEKEMAVNQGWDILRYGYKLDNIPKTLFWFNNCYVKYTDYGYYLYTNNTWNTWETLRNTSINLPIVPTIDLNIDNAIKYKGNSIEKDADNRLIELLGNYDVNIIKRLLTHIVGYKFHIELFKLNKQGYGSEYIVYKIDNDVYHILSYISIIYPAALQVLNDYKFVVKYGPLFWYIRELIQTYISEKVMSKYNSWNPVKDIYNRQLWEHQKDSIDKMEKRNKQGKKGHLIWIPVRFGKTLIVLNYLKYLIDNDRMPPYCVYTLPRSAITAITQELTMFGFRHNLLDSRKASDNKIIIPYVVNLIEHDHMRLNDMDIQLKHIAPNMIFINDEFHKTLNKTKRTSLALELARQSVDFIGLSGTIIQNENIEDIIKWLEQIVEFEVTETNFYVAISAMISKKIQTKVIVLRNDMEVKMSEDEIDKYKQLVPPALGGNMIKGDMKTFRKAANLCWDITNKFMIDYTLHYIRYGERVMIVAKDITSAKNIKDGLIEKGLDQSYIFTIDKENTINLTYSDTRDYYCVITTSKYNSGYSLSKLGVMITGVYFDNQATREQLEGRINEPNQGRPAITILTLHCGILTYTLKNHENVRSLSQALKGYADDIKDK